MADGDLMLMVRWFAAKELAGLPGLPGTKQNVTARAKRDGWQSRPRSGRGGGNEYAFSSLPEVTQAALLMRERPVAPTRRPNHAPSAAHIESAWERYERVTQRMKDVAGARLRALQGVDALVRAGTPLMRAREAVVAQLAEDDLLATSAASLARWQNAVKGVERQHWLALLVPHHTGRTTTADMPEPAWDIFKADWLRVEQPSATSCYERLQRIAAERGWQIPSLRTLTRRIERELPRGVRVLARQGEEAMLRTYPAQERDRSLFAALEGVNADGHRFDFNVIFPDGEIGRPMILGWQDLYSGKMLGWRLCDNESSDAVRLSLADLIRKYGVPLHAWLDNGRAFASKWMTGGTRNRYRFKVREEDPVGLMVALGIEVHWVTPYHGQAKPIERAWRDLCCERIAKHPAVAGAYVGNSPMHKPANYGSRAVPWDVFERLVADEIAAHNARANRQTKVCAGRQSFDEAFNASYAKATVRKVSEAQLRQLLLAAEAVTGSREDGSVRLAGNRYWSEEVARYAAGKKVVLRVDPYQLHDRAYVYALDGSYIGEAPCVASVGFADVNAARENARAKKHYSKAQKQMLDAEKRMDASEIAAQLPTPPPEHLPDAAVIAPVFRHHGAKRPVREYAALPATGTDGEALSAADSWITRLSDRLNEEVI